MRSRSNSDSNSIDASFGRWPSLYGGEPVACAAEEVVLHQIADCEVAPARVQRLEDQEGFRLGRNDEPDDEHVLAEEAQPSGETPPGLGALRGQVVPNVVAQRVVGVLEPRV